MTPLGIIVGTAQFTTHVEIYSQASIVDWVLTGLGTSFSCQFRMFYFVEVKFGVMSRIVIDARSGARACLVIITDWQR